MEKSINFIVEEEEKNLRVDVLINKREEIISRTRVKNLILKEKLKLNNEIIKSPSKKVSIGDVVNLIIPEPEIASLKPYDFKLNIVYEDADLLVINKPAGIIMHPGAGNYDKTIVNALMHYDKESLSTIGDVSKQFSKHTIIREYQLLIWGKLRPSFGRIETFITRSSKNRQLMEVSSSKGKKAVTNYKTIEIFENKKIPTLSLVECKLETGRTHQIRVHMNYKGNSLVGDDKYKKKYKKLKNVDFDVQNSITNLDRQFLHAKTLGFVHPRTQKELIFTSILPQELNNILKMLRNTEE